MSHPFPISRRNFFRKTAVTAAASGLPLWFLERELEAAETNAPVTSPNSRPGIALTGDADNARQYGDIVAVCDVDDSHAEAAAKKFSANGKSPEKFSDFRRALEHPDVHAIVQATPDHWHTLINLAAAKAGKDVYGEKPLTLTIDEGRHVIQAVRENKIIFQTGTQQRSSSYFHLACELVRNQRLGKLQEVHVFVPAGIRGNKFAKIPVPFGFNYDFWLGQTPLEPYFKERCHQNFRWWFNYAGGPVTDWGAHHNDIARWGIGLDGPVAVAARAITPPLPDGFTTPSEFEATLAWANGVKQIVRTTTADSPYGAVLEANGQRNGIKFIGADGWIWVNRDGISASDPELLRTPLPADAVKLEVSKNHMRNFFDCIASRKDPIASVENGHRSACIGHLIIIALRTGLKLQWNPEQEIFTGDGAAEGNKHVAREQRAPYNYNFVA